MFALQDLVVVSTDAGGAKEAKKLADVLGAGLAILNKSRPDHNMAEVTHVVGDVIKITYCNIFCSTFPHCFSCFTYVIG